MDLTEFLAARLDEDEAAAEAATGHEWVSALRWAMDGATRIAEADAVRTAAHVARHDPARTLREVEAGRKFLAWHAGDRAYLNVILAKAAVYRDHPDYDPLWAPPE